MGAPPKLKKAPDLSERDETSAIRRELARRATDRQLRASGGRESGFMNRANPRAPGSRPTLG